MAALAKTPKVPRRDVEPFTPEEVDAILNGVAGDPLEALYLTEIALGLRPEELVGITWPNIDFDRAVLHDRNTVQHIDGEYQFVPATKTLESQAAMPLPGFVVQALEDHLERQDKEKEKLAKHHEAWGNEWDETHPRQPSPEEKAQERVQRVMKFAVTQPGARFGEVLSYLRKNEGRPAATLAKALHRGHVYVRGLEAGRRVPASRLECLAIGAALGLSIEDANLLLAAGGFPALNDDERELLAKLRTELLKTVRSGKPSGAKPRRGTSATKAQQLRLVSEGAIVTSIFDMCCRCKKPRGDVVRCQHCGALADWSQ